MLIFRKIFLITGIILVSAFLLAAKFLYPFLAVNSPVYGQVLIVEGWMPGYAIKEACHFFREHPNYQYLAVTNQKIDCRENFNSTSCRDEAIEEILKNGINQNRIISVPDQKSIVGSRTYKSALAAKQVLQKRFGNLRSVDVFSLGGHARKSFVIFRKIFGNNVSVGVIAAHPQVYEPERWWMFKTGWYMATKGVTGYVYAELLMLFK